MGTCLPLPPSLQGFCKLQMDSTAITRIRPLIGPFVSRMSIIGDQSAAGNGLEEGTQ